MTYNPPSIEDYKPKVIDFIKFYPEVVDSKLCNSIISHYYKNAKWNTSTFSNHNKNLGTSKVDMKEYWIRQNDGHGYYNRLRTAFVKTISEYTQEHTRIKPQKFTDFRINRYAKGGFMKSHIDNIHHSHGQQYGYPHLTSLIFLNDDYDGGEFELCDGLFTAPKQQGSAVVFPSNFMYPHEVKKVKNGTRYSIMTWLL